MTIHWRTTAAWCAAVCASPAVAGVATGGPARASSAQEILAAALDRLGGRESLAAVRWWFIAGSGDENLGADLQGITPSSPTVREHAEWLAVDARHADVAWERRTPRNDHSLRWRRFIYRHDSTGMVVWTDSMGTMNGGAASEARRRALIRRVPHLLLLEAATRADSVELGELGIIFGRTHRAVHARLADGARITLWVSTDSSLLHRADYQAHLPGRGDVTVSWEWPDWRTARQLPFAPVAHTIVIAGQTYQRVQYSRFETGTAAADSMLTVPVALRARRNEMSVTMAQSHGSASPRFAATGEVSPGVHVESVAGFNVLVVEFRDFVAVVEAPAFAPGFEAIPATVSDARVGEELVARVRVIAGARPIRYAILSHHHSDHVGNVRALAALGATIIVPNDAIQLIEAALRARHSQSRDTFPPAPRSVKVEGVSGMRTIADDTRHLVIYDVGSNPHTAQNLVVWLPAEQIAFQGDLFYYDEGGRYPPSGREAMNAFFVSWLRRQDLRPRAVYGVHNRGAASAEHLWRK
jgi:glyoxylase-like metal-dependent hydrolase (beta-lactamase superfamily II)